MQHFKHHRGSSEALHQSRHCEIMWEDITEETNSLKVTSHNRIKHRRTLFCVSGNVKFSFFVWRCFFSEISATWLPRLRGTEVDFVFCFKVKWTCLLDIPSTCGFMGTIPSVKSSANKKKMPVVRFGIVPSVWDFFWHLTFGLFVFSNVLQGILICLWDKTISEKSRQVSSVHEI